MINLLLYGCLVVACGVAIGVALAAAFTVIRGAWLAVLLVVGGLLAVFDRLRRWCS